MNFCLPKFSVDKFIEMLPKDEQGILDLMNMDSIKRRYFFEQSVGKANASEVNALFESKLVLKNVENGIMSWIKKVTKEGSPEQKGLLDKVNKLNETLQNTNPDTYLEDFINKKLNIDLSPEEMGKLTHFAKEVEVYKKPFQEALDIKRQQIIRNLKPGDVENEGKIQRIFDEQWRNPDSDISKKSLEYGARLEEFKKYAGNLKTEARNLSVVDYLKNPFRIIKPLADLAKSTWATLDNSFQLNQGFQLLTTGKYKEWGSGFVKSWESLLKQVVAKNEGGNFFPKSGKDLFVHQNELVMDAVRAKAYSHPLALSGDFAKAKLAIGIASEESFPPSFLGRIPLVGRLVSSSEAAYNSTGIRLRVDLGAKNIIEAMEQKGGRLTNTELSDIGKITNSLTGRGTLPLTEAQSTFANYVFMSVRFVKSSYDILTAHSLTTELKTPFAKKIAAVNTLKTYASLATLFLIAKSLDPESVDFKNHLGEIKIYGHWVGFPITSMTKTASKIALFAYEQATNKKIPSFGKPTGMDMLIGFMENKTAPITSIIRDYLKGKTFSNQKPTLLGELQTSFTPIPIQSFQQNLADENFNLQLLFNSLEFIGQRSYIPSKKK